MSHITGGGLPGNLPRVLPDRLGATIETTWARAPIFDLIARGGPVGEEEMRRTFNGGIGFVFVVAAAEKARALEILASLGETPIPLGQIAPVAEGTEFEARVMWGSGAAR